MRVQTIHHVHFSPAGTTRTVTDALVKEFPGKKITYDLLRETVRQDVVLGIDDVLVVGVPVYYGRVPVFCTQSIERFKTTGAACTPAVAVAVYGNRDYEDALLELQTILESNGFHVVGAAACIGRHSIFPNLAAGRPDTDDLRRIAEFAGACARKAKAYAGDPESTLRIKGNIPYREAKGAVPPLSVDDSCTLCGLCADICPTGAISMDTAIHRDTGRCIACTACIAVCPTGAQGFRGSVYEAAEKMFMEKFSARKEPEFFV